MKKLSFTLILFFLIGSMFGQTTQTDSHYVPSGKVSAKIFTDFHSNFTNGGSASQFEVTRAYFGYGYAFSPYFSGQVKLDVGNPGVGGLQMTAYLKAAMVQYKRAGFTAQFGLIGTSAFNKMESQWGNRYLYKSFQDQNHFNPSADLGVSVAYKFNKVISADFSILNGEGYKKLQADSSFKYAFGITIKPIKSLSFRAYYDYMNKTAAQQTLSFFLAYTSSKLRAGVEYDKQSNHGMVSGKDYSGYSVFASYQLKKLKVFGRYDNLSSVTLVNQVNPWNFSKDGQVIIAGIEVSPVKGVKVSPNYQYWSPKNTAKPSLSGAYLSMQIKF